MNNHFIPMEFVFYEYKNTYHLRRSMKSPDFPTTDLRNDANEDSYLSINAAIEWCRRI